MDRSTSKSSDQERLRETVKAARGDGESRIGSSGLIVRLANELGLKPDEIAIRLDKDTIRRTKYPVMEERTDDGRIIYRHNIMGEDGPLTK